MATDHPRLPGIALSKVAKVTDNAEDRLSNLERLFQVSRGGAEESVWFCGDYSTHPYTHTHTHTHTHQYHNVDDHEHSYSVETLLDALMVLYDECCTSSFKKEKTISDFVGTSKYSRVCLHVELV